MYMGERIYLVRMEELSMIDRAKYPKTTECYTAADINNACALLDKVAKKYYPERSHIKPVYGRFGIHGNLELVYVDPGNFIIRRFVVKSMPIYEAVPEEDENNRRFRNLINDAARRWPGSRSLFFSRDCIESIEAVLEEEIFE